jgi:hypothetical protein
LYLYHIVHLSSPDRISLIPPQPCCETLDQHNYTKFTDEETNVLLVVLLSFHKQCKITRADNNYSDSYTTVVSNQPSWKNKQLLISLELSGELFKLRNYIVRRPRSPSKNKSAEL